MVVQLYSYMFSYSYSYSSTYSYIYVFYLVAIVVRITVTAIMILEHIPVHRLRVILHCYGVYKPQTISHKHIKTRQITYHCRLHHLISDVKQHVETHIYQHIEHIYKTTYR